MTRHNRKVDVIWDLGQVLIQWDREHLYRTLIPDDAERERFLTEILSMEFNASVDRGRPIADAVGELAARHPEWADEIRAYDARWTEMCPGPVAGSADILTELDAAGLRQIALSNWSAETFTRVADDYEFLDIFSALVISGEEGMVKPDPAIFELLCRRHRVVPKRALFIDDSSANVATAAGLGFDVIRFVDADSLRADLVSRGLLAPS